MELIIGFIVVVFLCMMILYLLNKKDHESQKTICTESRFLSNSSNKNSYAKVSEVFKTLENARVNPNFLGGSHKSNIGDDASSFDKMWDKVILRSIELCDKELNKTFKKDANVFISNIQEYKYKLEKIYIRKREWLKSEYLPDEKNPILDFHKLSAIMCRSIIGLKPFQYDISISEVFLSKVIKDKTLKQSKKVDWQINNVYVNYKLAFLVAEGIGFIDLLFWAQKKINETNKHYSENDIKSNDDNDKKIQVYKQFIDLLNGKLYRLYCYEISDMHDNFITSSVIALMKNDSLKRDFDYLQFSLSMFQWQEYTKKQCVYDVLCLNNFDLKLSDLL